MPESVSVHPATGIRCSDADRERTSERLRDAAGEGRLNMDELEDRLAGVYAARYRHELDAFVTDLPATEPPRVSSGWSAVLRTAWAQLGADAALLFGRAGTGWTRRRIAIALVAILAVLFVGAVLAGAVHGFGGGGIEQHRGFEGGPFGAPGHHF